MKWHEARGEAGLLVASFLLFLGFLHMSSKEIVASVFKFSKPQESHKTAYEVLWP